MSESNLQRNPSFATPRAGGMVRQGVGGTEMQVFAETHALASAAREKALIEAKITVALMRPRDWGMVLPRLTAECERPEFADEAMFSKPMGGSKIEGLSIRFAETAIQVMRNVDVTVSTASEDPYTRRIKVDVMDLENMVNYGTEITVEKTVERRSSEGRVVLQERTNTSGQAVYIVAATEDELAVKQGALVSKAIRNAALRLLPGDIKDACERQCRDTKSGAVKANPRAAIGKVVAAFAGYGIKEAELKAYLGVKDLGALTADQILELRNVYSGIKQGETTWADAFQFKTGRSNSNVEAPPEAAPASSEAEIVDPNTGEVFKADEATAPVVDVNSPEPEDAVDNFLWRLARASDDDVNTLAQEAGKRRGDWGDRAGEVGSAVSARRKLKKNGK